MDYVQVTTPDGQTFQCEIKAGMLRIGRSRNNDLILDDQHVSRNHAEIVQHPEGYYVVDVGSKTGVYVNGERIDEPLLLRAQDSIRLGNTTLHFQGQTASVVFEEAPLGEGEGTFILPIQKAGSFPYSDALRTTVEPSMATAGGEEPGQGESERYGAGLGVPDPDSPLDILAEVHQQLRYDLPLQEIFDGILNFARRTVPFERGVLMLREEESWVQAAIRSGVDESPGPIAISRTLADRVMTRRESILTTDALQDDRFREGKSVVLEHIRSAMCVPLWNNREVIGLLYVDSRQDTNLFTRENLQVLTHLANIAAVKIESCKLFEKTLEAQSIEREIRRAAEIQRHLLPAMAPSIPGYEILGESLPCHAVGGDTYEYLDLPGGRRGLAIGDVSGKGLSASLLMCWFQASLVALSELDLPLLEVIRQLNRVLSRRFPDNRFVTLFYGILDAAGESLRYVNAGHCPPLLCSPGKEPRTLLQTGPPLGLFEASDYEDAAVQLRPGDTLLCYTDGITSARSPAGEWFGEDRLLEHLRNTAARPAAEVLRRILEDLEEFGKGKPRADDMTLVILRRSA
jgi:phosphoserine phosphatase RsbU/P